MQTRSRLVATYSILIILLISVIAVYNTGSVGAQGVPRAGGTMVVWLAADIVSLNPVLTTAIDSGLPASQIFESLVTVSWNYTCEPNLATDWKVSSDGLQWAFHLVRNATWHDGVPFTSADVKFSVESAILPYAAYGKAYWDGVKSIDTPDNYTVVFNLKQPQAGFIWAFWVQQGPILPKHIYDGNDIRARLASENPVGTGPFKFKEWVKGDHVTLVRNENYWKKGKPYLDGIVYRIIPDQATGVIAMQNGEADAMPTLFPAANVESFRKMSNMAVLPYAYYLPTDVILYINQGKSQSILSKQQVRQATAYAIDKKAILQLAVQGFGHTLDGFWQYPWNIQPNTVYEYNRTKAEQLLNAAGYPRGSNGMRFSLNLLPDPRDMKQAELIADMLKQVGIDTKLVQMDTPTFIDQVFVKYNYDLAVTDSGMGPDMGIPAVIFDSHNMGKGFRSNAMRYNNSKVDDLFARGAATLNDAQRRSVYGEIQEIINHDLPAIPIYSQTFISAYNKAKFGIEKTAYNPEGNLPTSPAARGGWDTVFQRGAPSQSAAGGLPLAYWITIGVVVCVVAIGGIIAVRRRGRKN